MSPVEAHRASMALALVGAILVWAGGSLAVRPLEILESLRRGFGREELIPEELRVRPRIAKPFVRAQGVVIAAAGVVLLYLAIKLYMIAR